MRASLLLCLMSATTFAQSLTYPITLKDDSVIDDYHRCLKHHAASRIAFDQKLKSDRNFVIDTPSLQNRVPVVDDAEDAVVFMEVDADIKRPAWLVCSLAHSLPFYTIDNMHFGSSK